MFSNQHYEIGIHDIQYSLCTSSRVLEVVVDQFHRNG